MKIKAEVIKDFAWFKKGQIIEIDEPYWLMVPNECIKVIHEEEKINV